MSDPRYGGGYPPYGGGQPSAPVYGTQNDGPNYRWWIPSEGIRRDVIQADIQRYLGPDALVKPGNDQHGRPGYWIAAYRTLTASMVQDLKTDSVNFERSGSRGSYQDSTIHQSRHYWGPTANAEAAPVPVAQPPPPSNSTQHPYPGYGNTPSAGYTPSPDTYGSPNPPTGAYGGYAPQPAGYNPSAPSAGSPASTSSTSYYTTDRPPQQSAAGYNPYPPAGTSATPRAEQNQAYAPSRTQYAVSSSTGSSSRTSTASSQAAAPPGHWLASDGRYYPDSMRQR